MLFNVIGKAGGLRTHKDENVGRAIGSKCVSQENRRGVYNIINTIKFMEMDKIT